MANVSKTVQKERKLAPYGTDGRLLLTANFKVTRHKKLGQK